MLTNKKHFVLNRMIISETVLGIKIMNNLDYPLGVSRDKPFRFSITKRDISHNKPNTNYLKKTFSYSSIEIWNRMPTEIRNSQNINTFKTKFKSFRFENC